ncbi:MAG: hypothetical protein JWO13_786 [Acidobacteriales bacterium]|nr:hypothetical protein [Terriglobales bacterium]
MKRRSGKITVALFSGLIVCISGAAVQWAVIPWNRELMMHLVIGNVIGGLVAALIALSLQLKHEEQYYEFSAERASAMAELNHHVRNAIFPLCLAVQRLGDVDSNRVATEAVERINIALRDAAADASSHRIQYNAANNLKTAA